VLAKFKERLVELLGAYGKLYLFLYTTDLVQFHGASEDGLRDGFDKVWCY
jgi:hypothetical protein